MDSAVSGEEGGDVWIQQPMVGRVGMCGFSSQRWERVDTWMRKAGSRDGQGGV